MYSDMNAYQYTLHVSIIARAVTECSYRWFHKGIITFDCLIPNLRRNSIQYVHLSQKLFAQGFVVRYKLRQAPLLFLA